MFSRTATLSALALAAAITATASVSIAQAGMAHTGFGGSKMDSSRVTPIQTPVKASPPRIDAKLKLHCYHTRQRNELGVYVDRTLCN